jgi:arylsulfatase B
MNYQQQVLDSDAAQYIAMLGMSGTQNLYQQLLDAEISCGERPVDAHPCLPLDAPCLFDIEQDPCEYNNLAEKMPHITEDLLSLLSWYNSTAVAPLNTSPDPMSNPKYWNYTYTNWADFV